MAKKSTGEPQTLRSAERLLEVLKSFSAEHPTRTVSEVSEELELAPSTVRRLLHALERHGFVLYDDRTGRFAPHFQILRLAAVTLATNDLVRAVADPADKLAEVTGETVQITALDGLDVVHIDGRESRHTWKIFHPVGHRHLAYPGSASGKVLLAWRPRDEVAEALPDGRSWPKRGPNALASPRGFLAHLDEVAEQGYALNDGETDPDVWAVAAPVRDYTGEVVAAINLPVPHSRVSGDEPRQRELIDATVAAARATSEAQRYEANGAAARR